MSTRSNIYLKLKQETKGQTLKFNPELIKIGYKTEYPIPDVHVPEDANFIGIYHHWDGYLEGVGSTLLEKFTDYDKILNLLMMGDISTINEHVTSYRGWRNEDVPAAFYTEDKLDPDDALQEEYAYLFDGEQWLVTYHKGWDKIGKWVPLIDAIRQEQEEESEGSEDGEL